MVELEQAWELFRRGHLDQERHHRLVRDAVKRNLADLVTHGHITAGGRVRIPIRALKQWRFAFDPEHQESTGTFSGDPLRPGNGSGRPGGRPRKGDIVGYRPKDEEGSGGPGGEGHDEGVYEVEVGVEAVADVLFTNLELPRLRKKAPADAFTEELKMEEIRRKGALSNLDKRRTALENIRRNAARGAPEFGGLAEEDLRFRAAEIRRVPQDQVAVLFVRDRSGSMGEEEKYLTRVLSFWITRFLQHKYQKVAETAFVLFDTEASEVTEDEFIHRSEGGGTLVSTGFKLAAEIIAERFPPERYNLYLFAFSDGDNPSSDTPEVVRVVQELLPIINLIGYADIRPGAYKSTRSEWSTVAQELRDLKEEHLVAVNLREQEDVLRAMERFFSK